jgi:hypothetical protein
MADVFMSGLENGLMWSLIAGFLSWGLATLLRMLKIIP